MNKLIIRFYEIELLFNTRYFVFTDFHKHDLIFNYKLFVDVKYQIENKMHIIKLKSRTNNKITKIIYIKSTSASSSFPSSFIKCFITISVQTNTNCFTFDLNHFIEKAIDCEIGNMYISKSLSFMKLLVKQKHPLLRIINSPYEINSLHSFIFFGVYQHINELYAILNHKKTFLLIWGGSDIKYIYDNINRNTEIRNFVEQLKQNKYCKHISISNCITKMLKSIGFKITHQILLSFVDLNLFQPVVKGNKIYIYSSITRPEVYGEKYYNQLIKWFDKNNYEYVLNTKRDISHENIFEYYSQFYICIRLTEYDGNANTVQELGCMGIHCIHNGEMPNCLEWSNLNDVKKHIIEKRSEIGLCNLELATKVRTLIEKTYYKERWNIHLINQEI